MKIYDAFTFYNEVDLLRTRLVEHDPFVDYFILVEGDRTFSGHSKPMYFDPSDPRLAQFCHKIISVKANLQTAPCDAWNNERTQRRAILSAVTPSPDDILLISDVDEIVSRNHWAALLSEMMRQPAIAIRMACYYYYINLMTPEHFTFSKMLRYDYITKNGLDADSARWLSSAAPRPRLWEVPDSYGWHFSYVGSPDFIRNKISSFSHQEYNNSTYAAPERIGEAVERRIDLFGRWDNKCFWPIWWTSVGRSKWSTTPYGNSTCANPIPQCEGWPGKLRRRWNSAIMAWPGAFPTWLGAAQPGKQPAEALSQQSVIPREKHDAFKGMKSFNRQRELIQPLSEYYKAIVR